MVSRHPVRYSRSPASIRRLAPISANTRPRSWGFRYQGLRKTHPSPSEARSRAGRLHLEAMANIGEKGRRGLELPL